MKKTIHQKWLERVNYDIDTAEAMYTTGRYIYTVFMCQQALEKCFKAFMAFKKMDVTPVHNLRRLAEMTGIIGEMGKEELKKIDFLSQYYLNARYKEDIEELSSQISADVAKEFMNFSREKIKWLTLKMRQ
ncbi:MAG TPA: HEPN domain-containing protein [Candidatus Brocadiia bacterium]|nr:HEPN domain-containing protein [Planctomycetota bacterium]MDO8093660.1 HEPN domain-containing protein [Candidatus Brocadiales bacterium]